MPRCRRSPTARSNAGLRRYDKRHGWRRPTRNVIAEHHTIEAFKDDRWTRPIGRRRHRAGGRRRPRRRPAPRASAHRRAATPTSDGDGLRVDAARRPPRICSSRAISIDVRDRPSSTRPPASRPSRSSRRRSSKARSLAIDNHTGQIRAMVGGWSFARSKFNRAVQAYRQLGSTFKPIVYTAAIDRGFTPTSILVDEPVSYPSGNGQIYSPHNYDHKFEGPITLRYALEESRNIPAIKMMDDARARRNVLDYAKRFGFEENFPPYLPIALGAGDATLLEVTSAYTAFPNQGVRMKPFDVAQRQGPRRQPARGEPRRAERRHPRRHGLRDDEPAARRPDVRGTGARAASLAADWPLAGKTGTVDDNTDAWFIGFDPGHHRRRLDGVRREEVARRRRAGRVRGAADLDGLHEGLHRRRGRTRTIRRSSQAPGNIVFLAVDKATGAVLPADTPDAIHEAFIAGTQPGANSFNKQP